MRKTSSLSCLSCMHRVPLLIALLATILLIQTPPPILAQSLAQAPAPQSPHWSHINVFAYARSLFLANVSPDAYQWYLSHLDAVEVHGNGPAIRAKNPTAELFSYQMDLTAFTKDTLVGVAEEAFLHFSEPTTLTFYTLDRTQAIGSVSLPGCPNGTPIVPACRVQTHLWNDRRFVLNPQSTAFQTWKTGALLGTLNVYGFPIDTSRFLWIDEHAPGFSWPLSFGYQTVVQTGSGIREFSGRRPGNVEFEAAYADAVANWLTIFSSRAIQAGKKVLINANENALHPWLLPQVNAVHGMSTESKHRPDGFAGPADYGNYLNLVSGLTSAGGLVDLHGVWCYTGPAGFSAGNYATAAGRYRMWRLASYYQFKEPTGSAGMVYFNPGFCSDETPSTDQWTKDQSEWLPAYQVDVGTPTGTTTLYQQGTAGCPYEIFGRTYSKALILVRPQDSPTCKDYGDASAATVTLPTPVQLLREDGTLSPPVTTVSVRNAEAVIAYYPLNVADTSAPDAPRGVIVR